MARIFTKYSMCAATMVASAVALAQPPGMGPGGGPPGFAPQMGSAPGGPRSGSFGSPKSRFAPPTAGAYPSPIQQGYPGASGPTSYPGSSRYSSKGQPAPYGQPSSYGYPGSGYAPGSSSSRKGRTVRPYSQSAEAPPGYYVPSQPMPGAAPSGYESGRAPSTAPGYAPGGNSRSTYRSGRGNESSTPGRSWRPTNATPSGQQSVRPADSGYTLPGQSPVDLQKQMRSSSNSLRAAMAQGDQQQIGSELSGIRQEAGTLRDRLQGLPLEKRLHVPSIALMYDQGTRLVEEGMESGQDSKIEMGLEKIEDANKKLGELEKR